MVYTSIDQTLLNQNQQQQQQQSKKQQLQTKTQALSKMINDGGALLSSGHG